MTEMKNDGGPAFPRPLAGSDASGTVDFGAEGMSLRDWFAGQALAGICGDGIPGSHHQPERTASEAYAYADAMLSARQKQGGGE